MTIPATTRKAGPLLGTGAQTAWPFTFKVFATSDIRVVVVDALAVETDMVLDTDYSVSLNGNQDTSPGGTVTYPLSGSPLATGSALSIVGNLEYDQPYDVPTGGNFNPVALENELDRLTMQIQQLREITNRALLAPITSAASGQLPAPEANTLIGWNSSEDALQNIPLTDLATAQSYGSFTNDAFTGDGSDTTFALTSDPVTLSNLQVFVDGLALIAGTDYTLATGSVVFTVAPTNGAEIIARYGQALVATGVAAGDVSFTPSGNIAAITVQSALTELDVDKANLTGLRSYLAGCGMSTAGSSATMSIAAGVAQDSTNSATMTLLAIAKTTSEWAVGTATGGFDRGASGTDVIGNNSWYHFYVIRRPDTGVVDVCFSASATAPTATGVIPAAYTQFRRIGSGRTNGSAQWTSFTQDGDYFAWTASVADVNTTNYGAGSAISATLTVPTGVKVDALVKAMITDSVSPNTGFLLTDLSAADEAPTNGNNLDAFATTVGVPALCVKTIRTNTSSQVRYRNNGGAGVNTTTVIRTVGWYDTRGRNS